MAGGGRGLREEEAGRDAEAGGEFFDVLNGKLVHFRALGNLLTASTRKGTLITRTMTKCHRAKLKSRRHFVTEGGR